MQNTQSFLKKHTCTHIWVKDGLHFLNGSDPSDQSQHNPSGSVEVYVTFKSYTGSDSSGRCSQFKKNNYVKVKFTYVPNETIKHIEQANDTTPLVHYKLPQNSRCSVNVPEENWPSRECLLSQEVFSTSVQLEIWLLVSHCQTFRMMAECLDSILAFNDH